MGHVGSRIGILNRRLNQANVTGGLLSFCFANCVGGRAARFLDSLRPRLGVEASEVGRLADFLLERLDEDGVVPG